MAKSASDIVDRALTLMDEVPTTFATAATTETSIRTMALEILPDLCRDLIKEFPWELKRYLATEVTIPISYDISQDPAENTPRGAVVYNDKLYLIHNDNQSIYRYSILSDGSVVYDGINTSIGFQATDLTIVGNRMYAVTGDTPNRIYVYTIDTFGLLTFEKSLSVATQTAIPVGIAYDGNKLFISGSPSSSTEHYIYRYNVEINGDLTYDNYSVNVAGVVPNFAILDIKDDRLFVESYFTDAIYRFIIDQNSELVYDNYVFPFADIDTLPSGIAINGDIAYIIGTNNKKIYKFSLIDYEFSFLEYEILNDGESQSSYFKKKVAVKAPSDFWELVSIRLTVWAKPVTEYILINGEEYPRQNNPFTRSGKQNPTVALNNTSLGGNARIECFSIENGDASTVANFQYVSFNNVPDDLGNDWPDETFDEVTKALAAQLNMIKSRFDEGTIMSSEIEGAIEQHE